MGITWGPVVWAPSFHCKERRFSPWFGNKITQAVWYGKRKKKKRCSRWEVPLAYSVKFSRSVVSDSATPWIPVRQASLSTTNSWSLLKLMSIQSVTASNHLILCLPLLPVIFLSIRVFSKRNLHVSACFYLVRRKPVVPITSNSEMSYSANRQRQRKSLFQISGKSMTGRD